MSIYNVDFENIWSQLTPPVLRKSVHLSWGNVLMAPVQYLRDLVFDDYLDGSTYDTYNSISAYTTGDRVIYTNRGVYENISGSTGTAPTVTTAWRQISTNYIGVNERVKYNSQKLLFEHALNSNFQTSGIFIANSGITASGFIIGETSDYSTAIGETTVPTSAAYITATFQGLNKTCYTIHVPNSCFTGLSSVNDTERVNIVRNFADQYNIAGMQYSVSGF